MNMEKVFFLNRDHKNGERQTDSPFLWSLFRKETFATFIAHNIWRHENDQLQIYINKAISLSIDKIKPNPAIDQNVHCLLVEPYWKSPLCCRRLGEVSVNSDVQLDSCTCSSQGRSERARERSSNMVSALTSTAAAAAFSFPFHLLSSLGTPNCIAESHKSQIGCVCPKWVTGGL